MVVPRLGIGSSKPAYVLSWPANIPPKVKPIKRYTWKVPVLFLALHLLITPSSYIAQYKK